MLFEAPESYPGSLKFWLNQYKNEYLSKDDLHPRCKHFFEKISKIIWEEFEKSLIFVVHITPLCSVQSLHFHVLSTLCLTKAYREAEKKSSKMGMVKNVPVSYFEKGPIRWFIDWKKNELLTQIKNKSL